MENNIEEILEGLEKKKFQKSIKKYSNLKKWRAKNIDKVSAHKKVFVAMRNKSITRLPCNVCGEIKTQAHHEDYLKPLEVTWLCKRHHMEADIKRRARLDK